MRRDSRLTFNRGVCSSALVEYSRIHTRGTAVRRCSRRVQACTGHAYGALSITDRGGGGRRIVERKVRRIDAQFVAEFFEAPSRECVEAARGAYMHPVCMQELYNVLLRLFHDTEGILGWDGAVVGQENMPHNVFVHARRIVYVEARREQV